MQQREAAEDQFGNTFQEIYNNKALHDCIVLGSNMASVSSTLPTLPNSVIAAFSYSPPKESVDVDFDAFTDTMDAAENLSAEEILNNWKPTKKLSLSVVYDASKLQMYEMGEILRYMRKCIEDPDLIHV